MSVEKTEKYREPMIKIRTEIIKIIGDLHNKNYGLALVRAEIAREQLNKLI